VTNDRDLDYLKQSQRSSPRKVKKWVFEECEPREDVRLALPDGWRLRVFRVTSGDSGDKYWVQILREQDREDSTTRLQGRRLSDDTGKLMTVVLCDCMQGKFLAPLSILGLGSGELCKHSKQLLAFLKSK